MSALIRKLVDLYEKELLSERGAAHTREEAMAMVVKCLAENVTDEMSRAYIEHFGLSYEDPEHEPYREEDKKALSAAIMKALV